MGFRLSERSVRRLKGVHPRLVELVREAVAISPVDFMVTEGLRTAERQAGLVRAGASRTKNSRHLTGHAVDVAALVDGQVRWDWPLYRRIAAAFKAAAARQGTSIVWGGDWKTLKDGPHFELDRTAFPEGQTPVSRRHQVRQLLPGSPAENAEASASLAGRLRP